jgi:hypothetical protein
MSGEGAHTEPFTALDWIGVVLAVLAALALVVAPWTVGAAFAAMFRDFGVVLPVITRLALGAWFPVGMALLPLALALGAAVAGGSLGLRRAMVVVAFVAALGAWAFYLFALYAPMFELAGAIK